MVPWQKTPSLNPGILAKVGVFIRCVPENDARQQELCYVQIYQTKKAAITLLDKRPHHALYGFTGSLPCNFRPRIQTSHPSSIRRLKNIAGGRAVVHTPPVVLASSSTISCPLSQDTEYLRARFFFSLHNLLFLVSVFLQHTSKKNRYMKLSGLLLWEKVECMPRTPPISNVATTWPLWLGKPF